MIGIGWLNYFEGRVTICVAALLLGTVVTIVLSLVRGMLHRQTIREFGRWVLLFAGFCMAPPLLALIAVTSVEVVHRTPVWVWPVVVAGLLVTLVLWFAFRWAPKTKDGPARFPYLDPPSDCQAAPYEPLLTEPGWSMPTEEHWDR